jgi:hypothetical protein
MNFENGKKYEYGYNVYTYIGKLGDDFIFNREDNVIIRFDNIVASLMRKFKEPKEFTFDFYLHAGENWPLENYDLCLEKLTKEELSQCKYFCSEICLTIKFKDGVFTLMQLDGTDVSDKNIILYKI